jgi:hypothetical protein
MMGTFQNMPDRQRTVQRQRRDRVWTRQCRIDDGTLAAGTIALSALSIGTQSS